MSYIRMSRVCAGRRRGQIFLNLMKTDVHTHACARMHMDVHVYDLVPKGVHENRTKGVENKVDDTLKLVVFLDWAQC